MRIDNYTIDNLQPDPIDTRDYLFSSPVSQLPAKKSLAHFNRDIENQLNTGSCVANATVSALEILLEKANNWTNLSRLFIYYNIREPYENLKNKDQGAYLRDGFKSVSRQGVCISDKWPFIPDNVNIKPPPEAYAEASLRLVNRYERIPGFNHLTPSTDVEISLLKAAIAKGYPVTIGMKLGKSFTQLRGELSTHKYVGVNNDSIGGHAMCVIGYDDSLNGFIVENSWDTSWGDNGLCLISYDVMKKDVHDAWVCTEFANYKFEDEWTDTGPELKTVSETIQHYTASDSAIFTLTPTILSGTPPYRYNWSPLSSLSGNIDSYTTNRNTCEVKLKSIGKAVMVCRIEDSSSVIKKDTAYFTLELIDGERPVPIEPPTPEPVQPEPTTPPQPTKKKSNIKLVIAIAASILISVTTYLLLR